MKQKQTQKVVINIGETKPKRRAPRKKPAAKKPQAPKGGGGGPPPLGGMSMPSDFFPRGPPTVILPSRSGPIVESQSTIQQLVKPIEQLLLKFEQKSAPQIEQKDEEKRPSMRTIRDYMAQYIESFTYPELAPDPQFYTSYPSFPSSSTSAASSADYPRIEVMEEIPPRKAAPETGTQFVVDQPPPPLVKAPNTEPLIDSIRPVVEAKEEEDIEIKPRRKEPVEPTKYLAAEIQQLRDTGELTESFLKNFQVSRPVVVDGKRSSLIQIANGLGLKTSREDYDLPKSALIKKILDYIK